MGNLLGPVGIVLAAITVVSWAILYLRRRARPGASKDAAPARRVAALNRTLAQSVSRQIRADASEAARVAYAAGETQPANPHPPNSPQFVLWVTSWYLAWEELAEADASPAAPGLRKEA